jgi:hypothetical protein
MRSFKTRELRIAEPQIQRINELLPGVSVSGAIQEIIRRYLHLHDGVESMEEVAYMLKYWRQEGKKHAVKEGINE